MKATFTPWKRYGHDRLYVAADDRKIRLPKLETLWRALLVSFVLIVVVLQAGPTPNPA